MGLTGPLFLWSAFKFHTKIQMLRYPLSTLNEMMYCNERHLLLMKCFKTSIRYILKLGRTLQSTFKPFIGLTMLFSADVDSQIAHKMTGFYHPFIMATEIFFRGERYLLLMKCFKSLLAYIRKMWGVAECICKPRMGLAMPFYWDPISNYTRNTRFFLPYLVQ